MPLEKKNFAGGGMDMDTEQRFMAPNDYRKAVNCRIAKTDEGNDGIIENIRSNKYINNPASSNNSDKVIGAYEDEDNGVVIYFVYSPLGQHGIYRFDPKNETVETILQGSILNFDKNYLITGINVVGSDEEYFPLGLLYWTDDLNPPRKLNIYKAMQYTAGLSGGYNTMTEQILDAVKWPPGIEPKVINGDSINAGANTGRYLPNYITDPDVKSNQLKGESWQFKYRWVYDDLEKSAWSPISAVAQDTSWDAFFGTDGDQSIENNVLAVGILPGKEPVVRVQIAARKTNNGGDFFLVADIDKNDVNEKVSTSRVALSGYVTTLPDTTGQWYYYHFYNDGVYSTIDVVESKKLYDDVPHLAKAQEFVDGNRIVYGNVVTGQTGIKDLDLTLTPTHYTSQIAAAAASTTTPIPLPTQYRAEAKIVDPTNVCGSDTWKQQARFYVRWRIPEVDKNCPARFRLEVKGLKGVHFIRKDALDVQPILTSGNIKQDASFVLIDVDFTSSTYVGATPGAIANDIITTVSPSDVDAVAIQGSWKANNGGGTKGNMQHVQSETWSQYTADGYQWVELEIKMHPTSCFKLDPADYTVTGPYCNVRHAEGAMGTHTTNSGYGNYTNGNNGADWSGWLRTPWEQAPGMSATYTIAKGYANGNSACTALGPAALGKTAFYITMGTNNTSKYYGVSNSSGNEIDFHLLGSFLPLASPWGMHAGNFDHEKTLSVDSGYQQKMKDWYDDWQNGLNGNFSTGQKTCPSGTASPATYSSFKSGARHRFGLVYYDRANRSSSVLLHPENKDVYIPRVNETSAANPNGYLGEWEVQWEINHYPPPWAQYYQWVYAGNTLTNKFIQFVTEGIYAGSNFAQLNEKANVAPYQITYANNILVDITAIRRFNERYGGDVMVYDWTDGDVLRFIADEKNNPALGALWEFRIVGVVGRGEFPAIDFSPKKSDGAGNQANNPFDGQIGTEENKDYLILANESTLLNLDTSNGDLFTWDGDSDPDPIFKDYTLEIYSPKKTIDEEQQIYYEFGHFGNVQDDPDSPTGKVHGRIIGDVYSVNQTLSTAARGRFKRGDTFWRLRTSNADKFLTPIESFHFTDQFISNYWDKGRPNALLKDFRRSRKHSTALYSEAYIPNTNINGLSSIFPDVSFAEFERTYNSIQKLYSKDNKLIIFQEDKVSQALVKRDIIFNVDGSGNVATSDSVLSQAVPYLGKYGINKNPESFAAYGNRMYFVDIKRGAVLRLSQDGFTPISDIKMRDYFTDKATKIYQSIPQEDRFNVYGVYDIRFNEYIVAFEESDTCPAGSTGPSWDCVNGVCVKYCDNSGAFQYASNCVNACGATGPSGPGALVYGGSDSPSYRASDLPVEGEDDLNFNPALAQSDNISKEDNVEATPAELNILGFIGRRAVYKTKEAAIQEAESLNCSGFHTHIIEGVTGYMACEDHNVALSSNDGNIIEQSTTTTTTTTTTSSESTTDTTTSSDSGMSGSSGGY